MASKVVDYVESPYASDEQCGVGHNSYLVDTLRSLKKDIKSCKEDNVWLIQEQKKQAQLNVIVLQSLLELQRQGLLRISHAHEDETNGAYGSSSPGRHKLEKFDIVRDVGLLDTLKRRGDEYRYYSSFGSDKHHDHRRYHYYKRNDRGYLSDEFKEAKPPTFDGDVNRL